MLMVLVSTGLVILVTISLYGERDYLKNCQALGLQCEPGTVHRATFFLKQASADLWGKVREHFENSGSQESFRSAEENE